MAWIPAESAKSLLSGEIVRETFEREKPRPGAAILSGVEAGVPLRKALWRVWMSTERRAGCGLSVEKALTIRMTAV
jgi:hypothetical protein